MPDSEKKKIEYRIVGKTVFYKNLVIRGDSFDLIIKEGTEEGEQVVISAENGKIEVYGKQEPDNTPNGDESSTEGDSNPKS